MYKLLLIDDETIVRESISQLIDWEQYGVKLIGSCANAIEAIEVVKKHNPEIIITDIKMPVMNGIEFINHIKSQGYESEFIILSGYDEFEFAKKAMEQNVKHYILKPCSENEIIDVLLKTISDIKKKKVLKEKIKAQNYMQHIFLHQFIDLVLRNKELNVEMNHWMDVIFSEQENIFWISFECSDNIKINNQIFECFLEFSSLISAKMVSSVIKINNILGCFYLSSSDKIHLNKLTYLQKILFVNLGTMPIINKVDKCLPCELYECINTICGESSSYIVIDAGGSKHCKMRGTYNNINIGKIEEKYSNYIINNDIQSLNVGIKALFNTYDRNIATMVCTKLLIKCSKLGLVSNNNLTSMLNKIYTIKDLDEVIEFLNENISNLLINNGKNENFIDKIINYIDEHLDDSNLSLKWCSKELVFMNEDYVSRAFTKYTGVNFSTYLNCKRIERAKLLLSILKKNDPIYTVAEQVGLGHNPQYFSKIFKKSTGYTPKQYKKLYD